MGTISTTKRTDGSIAYRGQIVIKRQGKIVHRESKTFDSRKRAKAWTDRREKQLKRSGDFGASKSRATLADAITTYLDSVKRPLGRTKLQNLNSIKDSEFAQERCNKITSRKIIAYLEDLAKDRQPQTVIGYASSLSSVFAIAHPAWGMELDQQELKDAMAVASRLGIVGKSKGRDRRPTLYELDQVLRYFKEAHERNPDSIDMVKVVSFAIFSTRRQEEICRIRWEDFDKDRVLVRDMKNPGVKKGNDVWCNLPGHAAKIIRSQKKDRSGFIFPYNNRTVSARFTKACQDLDINDLRFHDLRHEGASWLAELGWTVPQIASVTGHLGWQGLQRYSHVRRIGDKYKNWKWLNELTA
jgi:integrase